MEYREYNHDSSDFEFSETEQIIPRLRQEGGADSYNNYNINNEDVNKIFENIPSFNLNELVPSSPYAMQTEANVNTDTSNNTDNIVDLSSILNGLSFNNSSASETSYNQSGGRRSKSVSKRHRRSKSVSKRHRRHSKSVSKRRRRSKSVSKRRRRRSKSVSRRSKTASRRRRRRSKSVSRRRRRRSKSVSRRRRRHNKTSTSSSDY